MNGKKLLPVHRKAMVAVGDVEGLCSADVSKVSFTSTVPTLLPVEHVVVRATANLWPDCLVCRRCRHC